jgi:hypothetical protein
MTCNPVASDLNETSVEFDIALLETEKLSQSHTGPHRTEEERIFPY